MRIWHITTEIAIPGSFSGGMGCHVWNVAREQAKLGHDVSVYCPLREAETHEGVTFKPWEYHVPKFEHECPFQIECARRTTMKLFREGRNNPPDIIHCHEWDAAPVATDLAEFLGVKCIATLHLSNFLNSAHMTPHFWEVHSYYLWWEQEMLRRADGSIAISECYHRWMGLFNRGKPLRTIHNGVNIEDFTNGVVKEKPDDRILAFFHGRLTGQKGLDIIAAAARERDDILWVLAGPMAAKEDGRCLEDGLLAQLKELERQGRVMMPGMLSQTEVGAWLRCCDVAVYPHKRAPFDCAVLEAMACGACVVTTRAEAIAEYTTDLLDCIQIEANPRSLLDGIARAMEANYIGDEAKKTAKHFSWEKTARETLQYYEDILNANENYTEHHATA